MKRYRDATGHLTMPLDQIAAETQAEARAYYQDGQQYTHQGRVYTLHRYTDQDAHGQPVEIAQFISADGYNLFTDPDCLGTFLPDIASAGLEITKV